MIVFFITALAVTSQAATFRGYSDPSQAPAICAGAQSEGVLVAHENCHYFYECAKGLPFAFECPENLNFNPDKNQCDWPENVDCTGREVSSNSDKIAAIFSNRYVVSVRNNSYESEAKVICAENQSEGKLVAHDNCHKFYECASGVPVAFDCPEDLDFNVKTNRCDLPENVDCSGRENNSSRYNVQEDIIFDLLRFKRGVNTYTVNNDPSQAPNICASPESDGTLVAHEDCHKFYKCYKGEPLAVDCVPSNLLYRPDKKYCDWPQNVDCTGREVKLNYQSYFLRNRPESNSYEKSSSYVPSDVPSFIDNVDPSQATSICAQPGSDSMQVPHYDCNRFNKCYKGAAMVIDCPGGLLYNPNIKVCDWPQSVDCGDRNTVSFHG